MFEVISIVCSDLKKKNLIFPDQNSPFKKLYVTYLQKIPYDL